nr:c-type cytochrome [Polaromonas jejuensis]
MTFLLQCPATRKTGAALAAATMLFTVSVVPWAAAQSPQQQTQRIPADRALLEHGRYLVKTAGCNDCHTPGYAAAGGKVAEKLWLTGDTLGWSGPWGTTYPTNLRLFMHSHTEASWLKTARTFQPRPPMPWFNVHAMTDRDLRAIYHYTRSLGPAGKAAPDYLPPGQKPAGPVVTFPG